MSDAEDDNDPHTPIVDQLQELLPRRNGRPYLSCFILTHPDQDHCQGFADLLDHVDIGELWFSPRIFREYRKDLCDDAQAFQDEAARRVQTTIDNGGDVDSGDRVRVIGYDELLDEGDYAGFPSDRLTVPGNAVVEIDGVDVASYFVAFIHAPFKDDQAGDRNTTSIAMQVTLLDSDAAGTALLLGDHAYPELRKIFDISDKATVAWQLLLAPHHCSKSTMYWQDEDDDQEELKQDILDDIDDAQIGAGYIIASSEPIPSSNKEGDNPPHALAKSRYEELVEPDHFVCTQEHPSEDNPDPLVFVLSDDGFEPDDDDDGGGNDDDGTTASGGLSAAVTAARGGQTPPTEKTGFGASY